MKKSSIDNPTTDALRLAIASLSRVCRENFTMRAQAARYGFDYGIRAKQHFEKYQEAIKIIQEILNNLENK